jgi:hypothetical protein
MHDFYEDSLNFTQTKAAVAELLRNADSSMTVRQIKRQMPNDTYLWDCLLALEASHNIRNIGSLMISRWVHRKDVSEDVKTRMCVECRKTQPLLEFNQEWAGAPSAKCKTCKAKAQKKRGRKSPVKG